MSSEEEERIRELAYQIWESEGKPEGHTEKHWQMARKLVESGEKNDFTPLAAKKPASVPKDARKAPAKDETQAEKPALLGKSATLRKKDAAAEVATAPDKAQTATKARKPRSKKSNS